MKVLIAEEDKLTSKALQDVLQKCSFITYFSFDGKDAISRIKKELPGLVIIGISLPLIGGLELVKFIKESETLKHIPVIVISPLSKEENILKALALGASDFIPKPFNPSDLALRIEKIFIKSN